jgi:hypothetical protein
MNILDEKHEDISISKIDDLREKHRIYMKDFADALGITVAEFCDLRFKRKRVAVLGPGQVVAEYLPCVLCGSNDPKAKGIYLGKPCDGHKYLKLVEVKP